MIKKQYFFALVFFVFAVPDIGCSISKDPMRLTIRQLQNGTIKEDTSYVYHLPYASNTTHKLVQGYFSHFSHKNRAALDFKMKRGTPVFAARNGVVIRVKEDGAKGGWNKKYRQDGNFIVIKHIDGSSAGYWHLQQNGALVNLGDTIAQGQQIAISGKTGYALFPHLHFLVWRNDKDGHWQQLATRFKTSNGNVYLRPLRKYRNNNF
jgi:murein DD-endopeptidase MepM/ murein hydrolase activator NlpD